MHSANAECTGAKRPQDSRGAHDSNPGCVHSRRAGRIVAAIVLPFGVSLKRNARFLRDVAQVFYHGQDQRDAIFAAYYFCFAFGIAGDQRPAAAGSRFGGAKDADVVVNLAFERIAINEAVNLHGAKKMAYAVANAALRSFLAKSKG